MIPDHKMAKKYHFSSYYPQRYVALAALLEFPEEEWEKTFDINVKSMFTLCKAFIPKVRFETIWIFVLLY